MWRSQPLRSAFGAYAVVNRTAMNPKTCMSGAACCVLKRREMITPQNAIVAASPMVRTNAMSSPNGPGTVDPEGHPDGEAGGSRA